MKKALTIFLAIVMLLSLLCACAAKPADSEAAASTTTETAQSAEKPRVAVCFSQMSNAYAIAATSSLQKSADDMGVDMTIYAADSDINKQVSQMESAINQKVDVIILEAVTTDGNTAVLKEAKEAGIPVIIYCQAISDPTLATCYVGVSNVDLGYLEMKRACEDIGGEGNIAIIDGLLGSASQVDRTTGYEKALAEYPNVTVAFEDASDWMIDGALNLTENWLQSGTELKAIVAQSDVMAMGAVKAIEDRGLQDQIKVYGFDGIGDGLTAIKEGRLTASTSMEIAKQSAKAVEVAIMLAKGESVEENYIIEGGMVDSSNVDQYLG